jgi:PAS domain S-box-containing protein
VDLPGTAWLRREPVGVPELSDDPSFSRGSEAAATGLVSGVAAPLLTGARVVAVVEGYRHEAAVPAPAVAGRLAAALDALAALLASGEVTVGPPERPRAVDEAVRATRLASVAELGRRALSGTASEQIAVEAVELAAAALNVDHAAFLELEEDGARFVVRAGIGWPPGVVGSDAPGAHGSLAGYTLIADAPVVVDDLPAETRFSPHPFLLEHGVTSGVSAVVRSPERPLGVVSALSACPRRFRADEIEFLRLVANTLAAAIARSRADAAVERSDALLRAIVNGTTDVVFVRDLDGRYLMINAAGGRMLGRPPREIVGLRVEDVFPADVAREVRRVDEAVMAGGKWRTYEDPIVGGAGEARVFLSTTGPYLAADGAPAGLIGIAHDITERKRAEDRQRLVGAVGRVLAAGHDEQGAVAEVASLAVPAMADWCVIELLDPAGRIVPVAATHAGDKGRLLDELRRSHDRAPSANVVRSARPELYQHVDAPPHREGGAHLDLLRRVGYESAVVVPLVSRGHWIGAITLAVAGRRRYSWDDLAVFEQLADRLALALDNARLAGDRARITEALQASVLPAELPSLPGLELAARLRASGDAGELGGGAYDAFAVEGGVLLMVGDVRVRGPEAATVIARAREVVRSAAEHDASPVALLRALNAALLRRPGAAPFCTAAIARLSLTDDRAEVVVACAAHPAPLVLRGSGAVAAVPASGGALGVASDVELDPAGFELERGDALALFTASACVPGGAPLEEALEARTGAGADELARRIEARTLDAQLDELDDDLVTLVARIAP